MAENWVKKQLNNRLILSWGLQIDLSLPRRGILVYTHISIK